MNQETSRVKDIPETLNKYLLSCPHLYNFKNYCVLGTTDTKNPYPGGEEKQRHRIAINNMLSATWGGYRYRVIWENHRAGSSTDWGKEVVENPELAQLKP